jgi:hypothetical protein
MRMWATFATTRDAVQFAEHLATGDGWGAKGGPTRLGRSVSWDAPDADDRYVPDMRKMVAWYGRGRGHLNGHPAVSTH